MYIKSKKFKRHLFIVLTVILSIGLVIPLASMFQKHPENERAQTGRTLQERRAELEATLASNPDDVDALVELGEINITTHDRDKAVELFGRALAIDPLNEDALYYIADQNYANGDHDLAIMQLEKIVANNPNYAQAYQLLGYVYGMGKNDYSAGIQALENYIAVAEPGMSVDIAKQYIEDWRKEMQ